VVNVGLTVVVPVAEVEVYEPGEIEIVVALVVVQFNELLVPLWTLVGLAAKAVIVGAEELGGVFGLLVVALPQPDRPMQAAKASTSG
jgi:hypothetical protein